jgi:hypothetical protein
MIIDVEPAGAAIGVDAPDGTQLSGQPATNYSAVLLSTGDYLIVVGGGAATPARTTRCAGDG